MNTGRNLNLVSAGIIIYLFSGAEFQSVGVSGLSWAIKYPEVINLAAILFWLWLVALHWLSRREGQFFKAWIDKAIDKGHNGVQAAGQNWAQIEQYFGITISNRGQTNRLTLSYVDAETYEPGVYVSYIDQPFPMPETQKREIYDTAVKFIRKPASPRYTLLQLHKAFPDVFWRVISSRASVVAQRIVPWFMALLTGVLLVINAFVDISALSGLLLDSAANTATRRLAPA